MRFVITTVILIAAVFGGGLHAGEVRRPNFLFIAIDDLNVFNGVMGEDPSSFLHKVYPDPEQRARVVGRLTPNLERLADMGVTFENAFTAAPLCGPSRTALLTGVPPHVSGYYRHDRHFRAYETLTDTVTLPQYLKRNGWFTSGIGKIFHKGRSYLDRGYFSDWPDQLYSWSEWVEVHSGTGTQEDSVVDRGEVLSPYWKDSGDKSRNFTRFGVTRVPTEKSNDYLNARHIADLVRTGEAVRMDLHGQQRIIRLPENQPWFLAAGLFAPHLPWVVEQEYFDLFPRDEMAIGEELLAWLDEDVKDLSPSGQQLVRNSSWLQLIQHGLELDGQGGDANAWRAAFQAYLAAVAYADRCLGLLLEAMLENPARENTVVIVWSDHGYHLGDKKREGKTTLWEAANRSNLLIIDPSAGVQARGRRVAATVSLQDIYPTVVAMAGLDRPAHVHGRDLRPLVRSSRTDWTHPVLSTNFEGNHALRTERYRYLRYAKGDTELYDLATDPLEQNNLAQSSSTKGILQALDRQLDAVLALRASDY